MEEHDIPWDASDCKTESLVAAGKIARMAPIARISWKRRTAGKGTSNS